MSLGRIKGNEVPAIKSVKLFTTMGILGPNTLFCLCKVTTKYVMHGIMYQ